AAVERAGRDGERRAERRARLGPGLVPPLPVETRDARRGGRVKRARERDHLAHVAGEAARQLAGVDAAQAPANDAQLPPVPRAQRDEAPPEPCDGARVRPEVPPEPPAVRVVAAVAEEAAQHPGRACAREPARDHAQRAAGRRGEQREGKRGGDRVRLGVPVAEKVLRAVVVYAFLVVGLRLAGKREVAQLNPFDLVVLLTLSNTVQNAIIGDDNSVTGGLLGAATLLAVNALVVRFLYSHERLDRLVEGEADVLVENGKIRLERLKAELITLPEPPQPLRRRRLTREPGGARRTDHARFHDVVPLATPRGE